MKFDWNSKQFECRLESANYNLILHCFFKAFRVSYTDEFKILSPNVLSINEKFGHLFLIFNTLYIDGLYCGAICFHEAWLNSYAEVSMFNISVYELVHHVFCCNKAKQTIVNINISFSWRIALYEGIFTDVNA